MPESRRRRSSGARAMAAAAAAAAGIIAAAADTAAGQATWRGLTVAEEDRCSPYDPDDYRYPQAVEREIAAELGGAYGPYTGRWFRTTRETDIEHIVARSEAHDSGLCSASPAERRQFAADPLNLTLAAPEVNRYEKGGSDAAEWLPHLNRCWFAGRVIEVRQRYRLTVDRREAAALEQVLRNCTSTALVQVGPGRGEPRPAAAPWDDDGNGRVTCAEARRHGIAPVRRGHPAYRLMRDADGDGVVCER